MIIDKSENTLNSNSAPLMTKNKANNGDVHLSDAADYFTLMKTPC